MMTYRCILIGGPGHSMALNVETPTDTLLLTDAPYNDVVYHKAYYVAGDEQSVVYAIAGMSMKDIYKSIHSLPRDVYAGLFMLTYNPKVITDRHKD